MLNWFKWAGSVSGLVRSTKNWNSAAAGIIMLNANGPAREQVSLPSETDKCRYNAWHAEDRDKITLESPRGWN